MKDVGGGVAVTALVGRNRPAAVLDAAVVRTVNSHGGLVFVTGEAGIGKTALVAEAAAAAGRRGALVATGTCWDRESAPGHWPWVQVLRHLRRSLAPGAWAEAVGAAGGALAPLLGDGDGGGPARAGEEGFGLHDAVSTLLVSASQRHPIVVVLDDLQWADAPSVRLLEFVTRHAWFERLLVIGIYRDVEVEAGAHTLGPLLLPLLPKATAVTLTGLDVEGVGKLLARAGGREPSPRTVAEVHRRTGGNPFFVEQTARLWQSTGSVGSVPPGVTDAVERRIGLLHPEVRELVEAAAVLGPEFDRETLSAMLAAEAGGAGADRRFVGATDGLLAEAVAARLLVPGAEPGRFAFVHDLVRETLSARLGDEEAGLRHAAAARALLALPVSAARAAPGEVAHHAWRGVSRLGSGTVVGLLREAAQDAWNRMASAEAGLHLERALRLLGDGDGDGDGDGPVWAAVALDLGSARHHSGDQAAALRTFHEVAAVARRRADPELLLRTALRMRRAVWLDHPPEAERLTNDLLDEAYEAYEAMEGVGEEIPSVPAPRRPDALARERLLTARAVELARAAGDDRELAEALMARHDAIWEPGTAPERQLVAEELHAVAERTGDGSVVLLATMLRAMALLEQGDPEGRAEPFARTPRPPVEPTPVLWTRVAFATLTGHFEEAREVLERARASDRENSVDAVAQDGPESPLVQQWWTLEVAAGRFDAADSLVGDAAYSYADLLLAVTSAERGDDEAARRFAARFAAGGEPPSRWLEPLWLRLRAHLAAVDEGPGGPAARREVRDRLAPLAGTWLTMFGATVDGPVVFWTALLDAADGKWDAACAGFAEAERAAERLEARPWSVRARAQLARALGRRGGPGDAARAAETGAGAVRDAVALGVTHLLPAPDAPGSPPEAARDLPGSGPSAGRDEPPPHGNVPQDTPPSGVFRYDGQVWTLTFHGVTVHVPDAKGLHDLAELIGRPGTDVAVADLLAPHSPMAVRGVSRLGADPVLDEKAKAAYRRRVVQLDEQIDLALARGDDTKAAGLDHERAVVLDEIRRATGLHSRSRRLGDQAERARKAVGERIRNTLRRLDKRHPALAAHLRASVSTGAVCRYDPVEPVRWER
ncbi:ATP-binding protein [Streptomyces rubiginosohelvolus]|uniref:ATP-binding protein n=1 Tax=Streptomyces rubiginosohelvolus TaxID=67362 RepID=UPI0035DD02E2